MFERIEPAFSALLASDSDKLRELLASDPELVHLQIRDNTLLECVTQPWCPPVSPSTIDVLIRAGARLDRTLNLAACWNLVPLVTQLLDAGADPAARADADITPLESAAFHGSADAADVLAQHGIHRSTLWLAAASGMLDLVRSWVSPGGELLRPPGDYRPDFAAVGRPRGAPAKDDPAEILAEAFVFAAANDRVEVVDYLASAGVPLDSRPYRNTTGLHLAVQFHKSRMVRHLLDLGASATILDDEHKSDALGWAEACANGSDVSNEIRSMLQR